MESIPLSSVATVNLQISPTFPARAGFGTLMGITAQEGVMVVGERVRSYGDVDSVSTDWGASAEITLLATAYFSQSPKPTSFMVGLSVAAETTAETLDALEDADNSWYGFAFTKEARTEAITLDASAWAEARTKIFFACTNDVDSYDGASTTDIAYLLAQLSLSRTILTYSSTVDQYPEASLAGRAFSVDFTAGNPSITMKFKQLPGITVEKLSYNKKLALDAKNCNALISIAGNFMYAEGIMCGGRFFDEVHGLDWLQNTIQTNVFGLLYTKGKIPYTNAGAAILAQQVSKALAEGVRAGLLAPGVTNTGEVLSKGYKVVTLPVALVSASEKEARLYKGISFTALGAGAIHSVVINGTFER